MKKKIFIVLIITFIIFNINCFAIEYKRSNDNLLIPSDVFVDSSNIDNILKTPAISSKDKIYDFLNILSDQEKHELKNKIDEFIKETKIDISIVTTNDLCGFSINQYSNNFYDYNDFLNEGIIFVIYFNDIEPEIYMGNIGDKSSKVFDIYNDKRINQTLAYVYKDIENKNYYKAIDDYINILDGFYRLNGDNYKVSKEGKVVKSINWFEIGVLSICLTFIINIFLLRKLKVKNTFIDYEDKIDNDSLIIKTDSETIVSNIVSN